MVSPHDHLQELDELQEDDASKQDEPDADTIIGDTPDDTVALKSNTRGKNMLGLDVRPITPDVARQLNLRGTEGVVVVRVEEDGAAAEAGLQRGDVIREVNRQRVRSMQEFERATRDLKEGDRVTLLLQRGPQALYVAFTVARG
ncbi:MAG: PDZ domain-containing protein [Candidatus Rokubacteria bacterium]|nr:PDZ domain-containing protein [Candidatus Rokubacteria bacterium]